MRGLPTCGCRLVGRRSPPAPTRPRPERAAQDRRSSCASETTHHAPSSSRCRFVRGSRESFVRFRSMSRMAVRAAVCTLSLERSRCRPDETLSTRRRVSARARVFGVLASAGPTSRGARARTALAPSTVSAVIAELQADRLVVEPRRVARPARRRDRAPAGARRARPCGRGRRSGSTSASATCASRSPTSRTRCWPSATSDWTPTCPPRRRSRSRRGSSGRCSTRRAQAAPRSSASGWACPGPSTAPPASSATPRSCPGGSACGRPTRCPRRSAMRVEVENDASLGALSEWMWGAGRGADDMAYLKLATGIGAGLIVRGRALRRQRRHGGRDRPHDHRPGRPDLPLRQPGLPGDARRVGRDPRLAARRVRRLRSRCPR